MIDRGFYFKLKHDATYVDWRKEATVVSMNRVQYAEKLAEIRRTLTRKEVTKTSKTLRQDWGYDNDNIYDEYVRVTRRKKVHQIYTRQNGEYIIYQVSKKGDGTIKYAGNDAYKSVRDKFLERNNLSRLGMSQAFGSSPFDWRICVPDPIYYMNPTCISTVGSINVKTASSIDGCSQYPTALSGTLPTTEGCQILDGTIKPNKDYPFAMYLKSGHVAIFEEFDTHDWLNLPYRQVLFTNHKRFENQLNYQAHPEEDVTVLMKQSDYSLKPEMEYFFNIKESAPKNSKEREEAKLVMNAFIGMLHCSTEKGYSNHQFNHLAAIAKSRANNNLIKQINNIGIRDIYHVCVDGIIYKGSIQYGVQERKLGNFEQEFTSAQIAFRGTNSYIAKINNEVVKYKHGSYDIYEDTQELIDDKPPTEFTDIFRWSRLKVESPYWTNIDYREGKI